MLSVLGLLVVLGYLLPQQGYGQSRLVLFALIAVAAILGAVGVGLDRPSVTGAGVVGLFLLGFWQAVLSVFIYPVIMLLLVATVLAERDETDAQPSGS